MSVGKWPATKWFPKNCRWSSRKARRGALPRRGGRTVRVVLEDDGRRVMLEGGVVASWDTTRDRRLLEKGELIKLKGRVTGYDDLFEEVRMDGLVLSESQP